MCDENPKGIASIILASTLPSSSMWEREGRRLIRLMPEEEQNALIEAEKTGNYEDPHYLEAIDSYMSRYCFDLSSITLPECFTRKKNFGTQSYETAWGPSEYKPTGTLKDFEYRDKLHSINAVSYTHLDVYKRQAVHTVKLQYLIRYGAVSYTHLTRPPAVNNR